MAGENWTHQLGWINHTLGTVSNFVFRNIKPSIYVDQQKQANTNVRGRIHQANAQDVNNRQTQDSVGEEETLTSALLFLVCSLAEALKPNRNGVGEDQGEPEPAQTLPLLYRPTGRRTNHTRTK